MKIIGNNLVESYNLLELYSEENRPDYISENGPKSYFPPQSEHPNNVIFDGTNWITYDISQINPELLRPNTREELHLTFRATDADSPIWYSTTDERDILVTLQVLMRNLDLLIKHIGKH